MLHDGQDRVPQILSRMQQRALVHAAHSVLDDMSSLNKRLIEAYGNGPGNEGVQRGATFASVKGT
jgi:hypothetical protein